MSRDLWDPEQYAAFSDERSRPFFELAAQVHAAGPAHVADLGCGSGALTRTLARRWPHAHIHGIDSSREMIAAAQSPAEDAPDGSVRFEVGDLSDWKPAQPMDVILSSAALQWVPEHRDLLVRWAAELTRGGWLAFQVPGNFGAPSHVLLRDLAESPRWRDRLGGILRTDPVGEPAEYLALLAEAGCQVNAWETTYAQILPGDDPVLEWVKGTALRPVLTALGESSPEAHEFLQQYRALLRGAYPTAPYGTVFPFRRIFVVARRTRPRPGRRSASGM
jgi:trans-aconitate 2-methyltransferase